MVPKPRNSRSQPYLSEVEELTHQEELADKSRTLGEGTALHPRRGVSLATLNRKRLEGHSEILGTNRAERFCPQESRSFKDRRLLSREAYADFVGMIGRGTFGGGV